LRESWPKAKKAKPRPATNPASEIQIIQPVKQNPHITQTVLARQVGISQSSISRILKANKISFILTTLPQCRFNRRQKNISCTFLLNK
jgi:predicted transcriptional regulator